jgi:hypothetical protein
MAAAGITCGGLVFAALMKNWGSARPAIPENDN